MSDLDNFNFDLGDITSTSTGLDHFFEARKTASTSRRKVASLEDLSGYVRVAEDTLVHRSSQELWSLQRDTTGEFYVERLFNADGDPLKE